MFNHWERIVTPLTSADVEFRRGGFGVFLTQMKRDFIARGKHTSLLATGEFRSFANSVQLTKTLCSHHKDYRCKLHVTLKVQQDQ